MSGIRGHVSVRSSNLHGWVMEVYDDTRPWNAPPIETIGSVKKPTPRDKHDALERLRQRQAARGGC